MSKRHNRKFKISRRLGESLWGQAKDPYNKRNFPPGMHGTLGYRKSSDYGSHLLAKQKLKKYYGDVTEKQFSRTFKEAARRKGDTGHNLIKLLESRLDAFVYRSGFVPTIFAARQFVNHKHVLVNGRTVNIASYSLKPGDIVQVKEASRSMEIVQIAIASSSPPSYVSLDKDKFSASYVRHPEPEEVPYPVVMQPNLIVEFYSR